MNDGKSISLHDLKQWLRVYEKNNPDDMLKIKKLLDEDLDACNILVIGARLEPGDVHQPHYHKHETVIVYGLRGKADATIGEKEIEVSPDTLVYIPPTVVHKFVNKTEQVWECVAMAIGPKGIELENVWINRP